MNTKNKIRDLGRALLLSKGYNAFSFSDISAPLNIRNAAIHYHYPTKESLGVDILRYEQDKFERWKAFNSENRLNYGQQLERFFRIYEESLDNNLSICLVGSVAAHYMTVPETMRQELQVLVDEMSEWLITMLEAAHGDGVFAFDGSPQALAFGMVSSLAGGLQLSRVNGPQFFQIVKQNIRTQLGLNKTSEF